MGENRSLSNGQKGNVPKLRFPGFEGEWTKKRLSEVATGFDYGMNAAAIKFDGTNQYIRITDIDDESRCYNQSNPVSPAGILDEKYLVGVNDILFARTGASTGKSYLYKETDGKLYFAGFLIRVTVNAENNSIFVFNTTLTQKYNKWVQLTSMRSGQPGINSQEYASYTDFYPMLNEQNKIAKFLNMFELRISKQRQLIETLKKYKRGLLDKIFPPKKDSLFPTVRLSKMADFLQGLTYSPIDIANSGYLVLRSSNIQNAALSFDDCVYVNMEIPTHLQVKQGDIIMCVRNGSKKLVGKSAKIPCEMPMTTWGAFMMIIRSKIDCSYIYQYLNSQAFYSQVFKDTGTATINQITKGILNECELPLPPKNERDRIATLLDGFDKRIESTYFSLLKMQDLRKSLLQQLFI